MLRRQSQFGFPPPPQSPSVYTQRMVPLTHGVQLNQPWPMLPPGSSTSMTNYMPLDGYLAPRSRLSSLNTIRSLLSPTGMAELTRADFQPTTVWISNSSRHALLTSNGSISVASFVSANGLGTVGGTGGVRWSYAQMFVGTLGSAGENVLLAAPRLSHDTIMAIYQTGGSVTGAPVFSYLTGAPKSLAVGVFDNYILAFNTSEGGVLAVSRIRWNQRGAPFDWTGEGSGFEDLLEMRGYGTAVVPMTDGRFLLFTDAETWQGVGATYPAQFVFQPLDHEIGCPFPDTIAQTDLGIVFVGSDFNLRLLSGGKSQVVAPSLAPYLRRAIFYGIASNNWALYDPRTKVYKLHFATTTFRGVVVNLTTGEWGFERYEPSPPIAGVAGNWDTSTFVGNEGLLLVNSTGTAFSTNSLLADDSGTGVTSTWQSATVAPDLPGNYKQLTEVQLDYRATSKSTVTLKVSTDGGNNYESTGRLVSLTSAPVSGRVVSQTYQGGAFLTMELTSQSTGYELHRIDATMNLGGRR